MARTFFIPGHGVVIEDGDEDYFVPGHGALNENNAAAAVASIKQNKTRRLLRHVANSPTNY